MKFKEEYLGKEIYCELILKSLLVCEENAELFKAYGMLFLFEEEQEEKPKKK